MVFQKQLHDQDNGVSWCVKNPVFSEFAKEIDKAKSLEEKADLLFAFWLANRGVDEDCFKIMIDELIMEAKTEDNDYALGWYNFLLGWLILDHDEGNHDLGSQNALKAFLTAQKHFARGSHKVGLARALSGEASAHRQYGQFTDSFDRYLRALDLAEEIQDKDLQHIITQNIAVLLVDLNQYDEALQYFEKGESYDFKSQTQLANHKNALGSLYKELGNLEKAEKKLWEALELSNQGIIKGYAYVQLGSIRNQQKRNEEAKKYLQEGLQTADKENLQHLKAAGLLQLAAINYGEGKHQEALKLVEESLDISGKIKSKLLEQYSLIEIAKIYENLNDFKKAYETICKVREIEQEFYNEKIVNKMGIVKVQQARKENMIYKDLYNHISTISTIGRIITSNFDIKSIGNTIAKHISTLMEVDKLIVGFYDKEEIEITYRVFFKDKDADLEFNMLADNQCTIAKNCIKNQESVIINDLSQRIDQKVFDEVYTVLTEDAGSLICTPLMVNDKIIGFMAVQSKSKNAYESHHLDILNTLAAYTAIALENGRLFFDVKQLSLTDPLTEIANRRYTLEIGETEFAKSQRYDIPLSVIIADIDHFKSINDKYGHASGDIVLKQLATYFKDASRNTDTLGRIGGEEFLFILPSTKIKEAVGFAQRMLNTIQEKEFNLFNSTIKVTVSFGVAEINSMDLNIGDTIKRADDALYEAKNSGRNSVRAIY